MKQKYKHKQVPLEKLGDFMKEVFGEKNVNNYMFSLLPTVLLTNVGVMGSHIRQLRAGGWEIAGIHAMHHNDTTYLQIGFREVYENE